METDQLQPYLAWFEGHVADSLARIEGDDAPIRLKRVHSLKVLDNAGRIAASREGAGLLSGRLARLARLAALLHDTGRFPQYVRYRTFHDAASTDHGRLGVRALKTAGVLGGLDREDRRLVLGAVTLHNRYVMPRRIPDELDTLTRIVRDADKLDIYRVMVAQLHPDSAYDPIVALHLDAHPDNYSEAVYRSVAAGVLGGYGQMVWLNDFKLLLLSWIYDLNYLASLEMLREAGYVESLLGYLPRTDRLRRLGDLIRADMEDALAGRGGRIRARNGGRTPGGRPFPLPTLPGVA